MKYLYAKFITIFNRFMGLMETRHYSWDSLMDKRSRSGSLYWSSRNIGCMPYSQKAAAVNLLWDNHISKATHLHYYISGFIIRCIIVTPRGSNYLGWQMMGDEPAFLEYGLYDSGVRYDINYAKDMKACPELLNWLVSNGLRFTKMYEKDKNL